MNVIYIDDDAANRRVLADMLALGKVPMAQAADAHTGLAMLDQAQYGMVLMDLRMPEMNGLTAIRKIRARSDATARVPIVVVTADLSPGVQRMCEDAGADGFLTKPVAMADLFDAVGAAMSQKGDLVLH